VPRHLLPATLLLLLAGPTLAGADDGLYLEADVGYSFPQSLDLREDELEARPTWTTPTSSAAPSAIASGRSGSRRTCPTARATPTG
jgi:hypothetical protein